MIRKSAIDRRNRERGSENELEIRHQHRSAGCIVFSAEPWRAHRPLKVGIGNDLVERGMLGAREVNAALKRYVDRLMYQKCLAAGGALVSTSKVMSRARCRGSSAAAPRGLSLAS